MMLTGREMRQWALTSTILGDLLGSPVVKTLLHGGAKKNSFFLIVLSMRFINFTNFNWNWCWRPQIGTSPEVLKCTWIYIYFCKTKYPKTLSLSLLVISLLVGFGPNQMYGHLFVLQDHTQRVGLNILDKFLLSTCKIFLFPGWFSPQIFLSYDFM